MVCWDTYSFQRLDISPEGSFSSVSTTSLIGSSSICGIKTDESVVCWNDLSYEMEWIKPPDERFTSVSVGPQHTCGIKSDRSVVCWGADYGSDVTAHQGSFTSISVGYSHTCGVKS